MTEPGSEIQGLILAAGYGTRLAPVTDHVPKPLLPVGGKTLLDHAVGNLTAAGVQRIAVNTHHLGAQVARHLDDRVDRERFTVFAEKEILGTGGALDNARSFLNRTPHFLIHNGDVLCDARLGPLIGKHLAAGALATLLLVDWPAVNSVVVNEDGRIARIGGPHGSLEPGQKAWTYTGIGVFSRALLADIGPGFSSLIDPLVRAKDLRPGSVRGFAPGDFHWSDLGTPARYLEALPTDHEATAQIEVSRITGHGSARRFWRIGLKARPLVAMVSPPEDEEFARFVAIGRWLKERDLGAPELVAVNEPEHSVLMEDVGTARLYERAMAAEGDPTNDYGLVVDHLLRLQGATAQARQECPLAVDRVLDTAQLRWETDYFRARFLVGHCDLSEAEVADLDLEFASLAAAVSRQPLVLIHRDFQSQNIHLQAGRVRLVDFQGLRLGPLTYDIMSLLWDPYVALPRTLRHSLLDGFCARASEDHHPAEVHAMALCAGLQRIMQALGAYAFLGHVKNKPEFLGHIPRGVARLRELLDDLDQKAEGSENKGDPWLPDCPLNRLKALVDLVP